MGVEHFGPGNSDSTDDLAEKSKVTVLDDICDALSDSRIRRFRIPNPWGPHSEVVLKDKGFRIQRERP